jgi:oxygen-independent coproporphyrinogen-3 oxidase
MPDHVAPCTIPRGRLAARDHVAAYPGREAELRALVRRYDQPGPRYTSYPTAVELDEAVGHEVADVHLRRADAHDADWSLYIHLPFCRERCRFCACAVIASPAGDRVVEPYLADIDRELALLAERLPRRRGVAQLHLGGGTPTYLAPAQLRRLMALVRGRFELRPAAEVSVEVDPRVTTPEHLAALRELGFGRVSLGVQDLDDGVQQAIGRIQPLAQTAATVASARALGYGSINLDLVYGLPAQTLTSFAATLAAVIALRPDRLAIYGYAHVPWMRGNQRAIDPATLPDADARLEQWLLAQRELAAAGYVAIGLDHFALPDDELARAASRGALRRNFMGYGVHAGDDILGVGVTAIGDVAGALLQNTPKLSRYREALAGGRLPVQRGLVRSADDRLRARVIAALMCQGQVSRAAVTAEFAALLPEGFDHYFAAALAALAPMLADGLVTDDGVELKVTARGAPFVRNAAMAFDARLQAKLAERARARLPVFSRTV